MPEAETSLVTIVTELPRLGRQHRVQCSGTVTRLDTALAVHALTAVPVARSGSRKAGH
jgi:hypothetical protein